MEETVGRTDEVPVSKSMAEAIATVEGALVESHPIKEIRGGEAWRYRDRWEVKVIGVLE